MNPRQRLLTVLKGEIPDCVPVAPDFSNMIPAKLTGKPFWQLYLYNDPPIWEAYIECAKYFNIDSLMDGYFPLTFPEEVRDEGWEDFIVFRSTERIITQAGRKENGKMVWKPTVNVYYVADPPTMNIPPEKVSLPPVPRRWEPVEGRKVVDLGPNGLKRVKEQMGDQGLVGVFVTSTAALNNQEEIFYYFDHPELHERWAEERIEKAVQRYQRIMSLEVKPDFICVGGSGTLVFQSVKIFHQLAFPAVQKVLEMASRDGIFSHVHSCGPEKELVRIFAEETGLTVIDPLEEPPMGDCDLAEIKHLYGNKLTLKGNLHTTRVMLHGTPEDVISASKRAIDAAADGGRFILSTGDQCGRDTPFENLHAMIETARTYGRYH
ncbi:uroporphyrinogen-III decarboxylase [Anaerolinea thermolimosa]|uniref:uroporphyrinogen decarboxylase family protein n=1 Tax=Anaerolinea thermolimosa TaxID=229919 RepID=UPI000782AE34|nr:uroporphyrinogen decarboxylase family protein [Anaerolinea thermolimosa]GAP06755.1 uroporphyrinogen-III decarboxylase [Anaerolinea thermolimosa]